MTLKPGIQLGPYEIVALIGAGGMGEVYRARDPRVGRDVAIKVASEQFTDRFAREIHAVAALNHPNIATLYDVGPNYLVMELVEGPTLAERIRQGPIPLEEALEIARQIADALEAAHEQGIVHRDLKPSNAKLKPDGTVKVLDFGLAKVGGIPAVSANESPTLSIAATQQGVILGTAAYMAPEQAKGKIVDKRADIWSFGVMLYEMLTGKQLFTGETVTDVLAAVVTRDINLNKVPPKARRLLEACLERDPKRRLRDIGETWRLLETVPESARAKRPWLAWIVAAVFVAAFAALSWIHFHGREAPEAIHLQIPVPPMPNDYSLSISPDGRTIAYVASNETGGDSLFIRELASVPPRQLEGTEGAAYPFWSPDSRSIGFFAMGRLKRVEVSGGSPRDICAASEAFGGTWNSDGTIIFAQRFMGPLLRVPASGGKPAKLTSLDESEMEAGHIYPHFLPDERHYLYTVLFSSASKNGVYVSSLDSSAKKKLLTGASMAIYAEPGYLLYQHEGTLFAQPFDPERFMFTAEALPIAEKLAFNRDYGWSAFGVSRNGVLIYRTGGGRVRSQFVWFDRNGKQLSLAGEPGLFSDFDISPDGRQIALTMLDPATANPDIWVMDWARNIRSRLTDDPAVDVLPFWSPDQSRIAFVSWRKGKSDFFEKNSNGVGVDHTLIDSPDNEQLGTWSRDNRFIAYEKSNDTDYDIFVLPLYGERKPFSLVQLPGSQFHPSIDFDSRWLAYHSDESGTYQIYLVSFPTADRKRQISNNGGVQARWRDDGKELYYLGLDGKLMSVEITVGAAIDSGIPRVLFDTQLKVNPISMRQYAVTPDGQRFLLLKPLTEAAPTPITVVLNWQAELTQRVPTK